MKQTKKTTCVDEVFLIVYILITFFAATTYTVSLIKNNINDKESVYIDCEEYEVFSTYSSSNIFKKYNYSVVIKFDHDKYAIFKTTNFIPKRSIVVIQFEEYSNGDTYASIIGVNCKRLLIEEGERK
ncbi:MAG: hypothetical protein PHF05_06100 [Candidatus Izemoplasmatales bacterium]|nr:hypothetical protein [Candidatus Izemoplasmatales bacterium]